MAVNIVFRTSVVMSRVRLERAAGILLASAGMRDRELSLLVTDDMEIAGINRQWLGRKGPTNVISFAQDDENCIGDIVISAETARREAADGLSSLDTRLVELLVHGFVHLLGEDHVPGGEAARRMKQLERHYLSVIQKGYIMADLCVNVDHVATIREARGGVEPEPVTAAGIVELAGADGVVVHLREDRRHIQDRDVRIIREICRTRLTLEMAATDEMISIALDIRPDIVTLVPEKREEITTEGGLDVAGLEPEITEAINKLHDGGIPVSLFIDPEQAQVEASARCGAECIELHTGRYAEARPGRDQEGEFEQIVNMARLGDEAGLRVHAGHGLDYLNTPRLASTPEIVEFSIGHSIISRAVFTGLERAVKEMLSIVKQGH
jgi:pyridoxine 5-phosphate synthase